jgi:predicted nuclease of restriction endonuclease-like RecB superfamily
MQHNDVQHLRLFDERDLPWIDELLDLVEATLNQPWRVLLERLEHAPIRWGKQLVSARARGEIINALRKVLGGRGERQRIARRLRAIVLGHPALERADRDARIAAAAGTLGIEPADIEMLLWTDLARERPVVLPRGRPDPLMLAAIANVDRIQREMRRARQIELRVQENPHELVRMAARCGLLTTVTPDDRGLLLQIAGPLELFHATTVYGRALGALVPLLAEHRQFELAIHRDAKTPATMLVEPPVLLPPYEPRGKKLPLATRLARDLEAGGRTVDPAPEPITVGDHVLFPDLVDGDVAVELVGFSTDEYLAQKLARYREAKRRAILCVDGRRSTLAKPSATVLVYKGRIPLDELVELLERAP